VNGSYVNQPPARVLLCLDACFGEFYLPLDLNEPMVCPVDSSHRVAVYSSPCIHQTTDSVALRASEASNAQNPVRDSRP
jgi:hypothetical protein